MSGYDGNKNAEKHGGYGLKKRIETGLTTKEDYSRVVSLVDRWGATPAKLDAMGADGSFVWAIAWQGVIAEDAVGAYLFTKENDPTPDDVNRLGRNAQYHLEKYSKHLPTVSEIMKRHNQPEADYEIISSSEDN